MLSRPLPTGDLAGVIEGAQDAFSALRRARLFVTGGTGFFGHWLLESLLKANREMRLDMQVFILTRNAAAFRRSSPWIGEDSAVGLIEGDVRNFRFPAGELTHLIHAATDSGGQQRGRSTIELHHDILGGTHRVLDFARASGVRRMLYISTGAVYGRSTTLPNTPESYLDEHAVSLPQDSYEMTKLAAERLCTEQTSMECVIARPFAFVGPRLPLDKHFAIGNFVGAAMRGETIVVRGDGTPRRSWMYMSDLAVWLWTMLVRGTSGRAYNVGSEEAYSISEAAQLTVEALASGVAVGIVGAPVSGAALNSYVPSVQRARAELGLRVEVPLTEALKRTAQWYRDSGV